MSKICSLLPVERMKVDALLREIPEDDEEDEEKRREDEDEEDDDEGEGYSE